MDIMETFFQNSFSVAVAAFLLLRMEKRLAALTDAIKLLRYCSTCVLSPFMDATGDKGIKNEICD